MRYITMRHLIAVVVVITVAGLAFASIPATQAVDDNRAPELPLPLCEKVQVPQGNKVVFHVYALGVQVYKWNGATWDFVEPVAKLFADPDYRATVGNHYRGPTWESNSGSNVVGMRVEGCQPDPSAIAWLRLKAVSTDGPGIFSNVTFIQRVNTEGGTIPATPGSSIGEEKRVPYTAEYYFYRAED